MSGAVLSWSGGKDSALALWAMRGDPRTEPVALLTTVVEGSDRVGTHAVRAELVRAQAAAARLPLVEAPIPLAPSNAVYEERVSTTLPAAVETVAFADLFLADIRAYREEWLAAIGGRGRSGTRAANIRSMSWPWWCR